MEAGYINAIFKKQANSLLCLRMAVQVAKNDGSGQQVLMKSRRIDGSTTLDMREQAIKEFNSPDSGEWWVRGRLNTCTAQPLWQLTAGAPGGAAHSYAMLHLSALTGLSAHHSLYPF